MYYLLSVGFLILSIYISEISLLLQISTFLIGLGLFIQGIVDNSIKLK